MGGVDGEVLWRLYVDEGMTIAAIARRFGVASQTVHNWLVAAGVPRRPSPARPRTDIDDGQIRRLYVEEGLTATEIATRLNTGASTVYHRLERLGVPRRPPRPRRQVRPNDSDLHEGYVQQGRSLRQLGDRYGVTAQAVRGWLIDAGIGRRPAGQGREDVESDRVVALYGAGCSGLQIAGLLGCSTSLVYRRLEDAGVARRPLTPAIGRAELLASLDRGLSAPEIADELSVSVSCVCRALAREGLLSGSQAARQQRARRIAERQAAPTRLRTSSPASG